MEDSKESVLEIFDDDFRLAFNDEILENLRELTTDSILDGFLGDLIEDTELTPEREETLLRLLPDNLVLDTSDGASKLLPDLLASCDGASSDGTDSEDAGSGDGGAGAGARGAGAGSVLCSTGDDSQFSVPAESLSITLLLLLVTDSRPDFLVSSSSLELVPVLGMLRRDSLCGFALELALLFVRD